MTGDDYIRLIIGDKEYYEMDLADKKRRAIQRSAGSWTTGFQPSRKNVAITANQIALILTAIVLGLEAIDVKLPVTDEVIIIVSGSLAGLLNAVNIVLTIVTTRKLKGADALTIGTLEEKKL